MIISNGDGVKTTLTDQDELPPALRVIEVDEMKAKSPGHIEDTHTQSHSHWLSHSHTEFPHGLMCTFSDTQRTCKRYTERSNPRPSFCEATEQNRCTTGSPKHCNMFLLFYFFIFFLNRCSLRCMRTSDAARGEDEKWSEGQVPRFCYRFTEWAAGKSSLTLWWLWRKCNNY